MVELKVDNREMRSIFAKSERKRHLPAVIGVSLEASCCVVSDESWIVLRFPWGLSGNKLVEEPSSDAIIDEAEGGDSNLVAELNKHTHKDRRISYFVAIKCTIRITINNTQNNWAR